MPRGACGGRISVALWGLDSLVLASEWLHADDLAGLETPENWVVFADFMAECGYFAFRLTPDPDGTHPVALFNGSGPELISRRYREALCDALEDGDRLLI